MSADTVQESMSEGQGTLLKNPEERKSSVAAFLLFITIVVQKEKIQEEKARIQSLFPVSQV